jgi:thiol-disulfide isomerase/thioredoxin
MYRAKASELSWVEMLNLEKFLRSMLRVILFSIYLAVFIFLPSSCGNVLTGVQQSPDPELAPDFLITLYQGQEVLGAQEVRLSQLVAMGKPVVINFWAGACPPCRAEMPDFDQVYAEFKDRILMLGLDVGPFLNLGSRDDARKLLNDLEITYPVGTTFDGQVVSDYGIIGMPTTILVAPSGEIHRKWTGFLNKEKLVELVETLLAVSLEE